MTAYPTTCLVDYEDGYRTVVTVEEPSGDDAERGAVARLRVESDGKTIEVGLSPEALNHLGKRFDDLRVEHGSMREPEHTERDCPGCRLRLRSNVTGDHTGDWWEAEIVEDDDNATD